MEKLKRHADSVTRATGNLLAERLTTLKTLIPDAFSEGKLDIARLREAVGDVVDDRPERYSFSWAGKRDAIRLLQVPSRATLTPAPHESIGFDVTGNVFIEGDNLEVLKLLHKSYAGRVRLIYIDPPYNNGGELVYPDDFTDPLGTYLKVTGQADEAGNLLRSNSETSGRYHSAWLSMLYPRLFLARQLLANDGVIFVSIDDHEASNLRKLLDEVFGEENWVGTIVWQNATDNNPSRVVIEHEYIHVYAKQLSAVNPVWRTKVSEIKGRLCEVGRELVAKYPDQAERQAAYTAWFRDNKPYLWPLDRYKYIDERGIYIGSQSVHNPGREGYRYDVPHPVTKKPCKLPLMGYRFPPQTMNELLAADRILFGEDENKIIELKVYAEEFEDKLSSVITLDGRLGAYDLSTLFPESPKLFTNPKPVRLISQLLSFVVGDHDCVMDFFAGSCTLAQSVLELNAADGGHRQFVVVQLPEPLQPTTEAGKNAISLGYKTIAEIGKERIRRVVKALQTKQQEAARDAQDALPGMSSPVPDIDLGFRVFKLATSRFLQWSGVEDKQPAAYATQMQLYKDPLVRGWTVEDVIWEIAVKQGYGMTSRITKDKTINGNTIWRVVDEDRGQSFRICLDEKLSAATVKKLDLNEGDLFVCRDSAIDDSAAANLALQCELRTI